MDKIITIFSLHFDGPQLRPGVKIYYIHTYVLITDVLSSLLVWADAVDDNFQIRESRLYPLRILIYSDSNLWNPARLSLQ